MTFTHSLLKAVVVSLSEVSCCLALPVYDPIHLLVPISCYQSQNLPSLLKSPVLLRAGVLSRFSHVSGEETGMSGNFLIYSKCVKDPLEVPEVRCD